MATVIRSASKDAGIAGQAFNFDDIAKSAENYLDKVRAEAKQIVTQANVEAKKIRDQADREGLRSAMTKVDEICTEKVGQQMKTLAPAIEQVVRKIDEAKHSWITHWETRAVELAGAIAARVVRRELTQQPEITADLIREALELAAGSANIRLLLHPDDHATLGTNVQQIISATGKIGDTEVVADESIAPGGCRVETRFGVIDQSVSAQIDRITEELV